MRSYFGFTIKGTRVDLILLIIISLNKLNIKMNLNFSFNMFTQILSFCFLLFLVDIQQSYNKQYNRHMFELLEDLLLPTGERLY
jgi:hypothetical protein